MFVELLVCVSRNPCERDAFFIKASNFSLAVLAKIQEAKYFWNIGVKRKDYMILVKMLWMIINTDCTKFLIVIFFCIMANLSGTHFFKMLLVLQYPLDRHPHESYAKLWQLYIQQNAGIRVEHLLWYICWALVLQY